MQVIKKFYSVPFQNVCREVRVRLMSKLVEVFDQDLNPLAVHGRLYSRETHSTNPCHYPEEMVALTQCGVQQALREASKVGPATEKLIGHLLSGSYPLKYLRRAQGILRLHRSNLVSREGLEHACKLGLTFNKYYQPYIQSTAEYFDRSGNRPSVVKGASIREAGSIYLHNTIPEEEL